MFHVRLSFEGSEGNDDVPLNVTRVCYMMGRFVASYIILATSLALKLQLVIQYRTGWKDI